MYLIEIYNNETSQKLETLEFNTKRQATIFLKSNCEKRGYDFFSKEDRSIEYKKQF